MNDAILLRRLGALEQRLGSIRAIVAETLADDGADRQNALEQIDGMLNGLDCKQGMA